MFTFLTKIKHTRFSQLRRAIPLAAVFLIIEFYDELSYAIGNAALPSIRTDLALSYAQVGLLLGLPHLINTLVEPILMLLGDTRLRKALVIGGGVATAIAALLVARAGSFGVLLAAFILSHPASGAFVTLSQATLIDLNPGREPHWMARWTLAGSLGNLIGPALLAGGLALAFGWRWIFYLLAGLALGLTLLAALQTLPRREATAQANSPEERESLRSFLQELRAAARNRELLRYTGLQITADLMMDIYLEYLPLYYVDVVGLTSAQTGLVISAYIFVALISDIILIPLLERVPGRKVVRASATVAIILYIAWLLVPWTAAKIALLLCVSLAKIGWYPVLAGEAYAAAPGRSGMVKAIDSVGGLPAGGLRWLVGWVASRAGLPVAMWLLLLGPVSLILCVPKALKDGK